MEAMITGYIDFANSAVAEQMESRDVTEIVKDSIAGFNLPDTVLVMTTPDTSVPAIQLRPRLIRRAIDNLIGNAIRYGSRTEVSIERDEEQIQILVDDDGPGIPKEHRIGVLRPLLNLTLKVAVKVRGLVFQSLMTLLCPMEGCCYSATHLWADYEHDFSCRSNASWRHLAQAFPHRAG